MLCTEFRRPGSNRAVHADKPNTSRVKEAIYGRGGCLLQRSHDHLGVDRRTDQQLVAGSQSRTELLHGTLVLCVPGVEKRDQQIGIER